MIWMNEMQYELYSCYAGEHASELAGEHAELDVCYAGEQQDCYTAPARILDATHGESFRAKRQGQTSIPGLMYGKYLPVATSCSSTCRDRTHEPPLCIPQDAGMIDPLTGA